MRNRRRAGSSIRPSASTTRWRWISCSNREAAMHARHALRLGAAAFAIVAALSVNLGPASAQTYPTKSITLVVPLAAGTGMDTIARLYAEQLSHTLGKPLVIDNR